MNHIRSVGWGENQRASRKASALTANSTISSVNSSSKLLLPFSECNKPRFDILFHTAVIVIVRAGFSAS